MALVFCTKCGNRVSTTAIKCPRCGTPPYTLRRTAQEVQQANAPTQQFIKRRPAAPASNPRDLLKIRGFRADQLSARQIAVAVCALIVGWWIFFSVPASPSYAIYSFYRNVKAHDAPAAAAFVDFKSVTKAVTIETMRAEAEQYGSFDESAEIMGRQLANQVSSDVAETNKFQFEQLVDGTSGKYAFTLSFGDLVGAIWYLHRNGNEATTRFKDQDGNVTEVTFVRQPDSQWRVTALGGPGFRKLLREQIKKQPGGGSLPLLPLLKGLMSPGGALNRG